MSEASAQELDVKAIAEGYLAAWEARDPDAIAALHTADTQFWTRLGTEPVRGRGAVRAAFAELFERFPEFSFEAHRVLYGEGHWVLDWALISGKIRFDCLDVVNISPEGLVVRKDTFVDMVQLQASMPERDVATERHGSSTSGRPAAARSKARGCAARSFPVAVTGCRSAPTRSGGLTCGRRFAATTMS